MSPVKYPDTRKTIFWESAASCLSIRLLATCELQTCCYLSLSSSSALKAIGYCVVPSGSRERDRERHRHRQRTRSRREEQKESQFGA